MKALKVLALLLIFGLLYLGLGVIQLGIDATVGPLNPSFYTSTLEELGVYQAVGEAAVEALGETIGQLPAAEADRIEAAILSALDPEWLQAEVGAVLEDLSLFLRGRDAELTAALPTGEMTDRFIEAYAAAGGNRRVVSEIRQTFSDIPEEIAIRELLPDEYVSQTELFTRLTSIVPLVLVGVWLILALLCFPLAGGGPGGFRWLGAVFVASGLTTAVGAWVAGTLSYGILAGIEPAVPVAALGTVVKQLVSTLAEGALATVRNTGLIVMAAGVGLYIVAALMARARAGAGASKAGAADAGTESPATPPAAASEEAAPDEGESGQGEEDPEREGDKAG